MGKSKFHRRQKLPRQHSDHPGTRKTRRWEGQLTGLEAAINKANRASRVALYRARKALHKSADWDTLTKEEQGQREEEVVNANSRTKETKITQLRKEWHGIEPNSDEEEMEEQLTDGREEDIPDEDSWTSSPAGRRDSTDPGPAPGDPEGNYVFSGEDAESDDPEFDGYDDEPVEDGEIGEIHEEIKGSLRTSSRDSTKESAQVSLYLGNGLEVLMRMLTAVHMRTGTLVRAKRIMKMMK